MAKDSAYKVDPNDGRLLDVKEWETATTKESDAMYDDMIGQSDSYFNAQIDAVNEYGEAQKKNQQAQTDQAIAEIEQQKEYAHKDYLKEQSGAYADWQKQSDKYGVNAEQRAAQGMAGTGYSESSQVAMYNTYQNRVATARESYQRSVDSYNNAITEARLQNNSLLAEIAFNTLQTSLELGLEGFQYKNTLMQAKVADRRDISNMAWTRYTDTLSQINTENAMRETIRSNKANEQHQAATLAETIRSNKAGEQHNKSVLAEQIRSNKAGEQHNKSVLAEQIRSNKADETYKNKSLTETIRSNKAGEQHNKSVLAEQKRSNKADERYKSKTLAEQIRSNKADETYKNKTLAEQKRQYDKDYELQKKNLNNSGSGGSGSGSGSGSGGGGGGDYNPKKDDRPTATRDDGNTTPKTTREQALNKVNKGQIKTYAQAQALLKKYNIKPKVPMLDSATWQKAKKTGVLSSEFEGISTYAQYVQRYCRYALGA